MNILVTGGAGFIGSHTVDALLRDGHRVRVLDSLAPPVHEQGRIPDYLPINEIDFQQGDVRDREAWRKALEGIDAVFHFAAYQDYLPDFSRFFHVNAVGTALLYEVAVENKLPLQKIVLASSQATYGEAKYECRNQSCPSPGVKYPLPRPEVQLQRQEWEVRCPDCATPLEVVPTDEAVVKPHNQYALSKYTQELMGITLGRRYNIPTVAMRFSIVQGARQSFRNAYSGVLRIFSQQVLNGEAPLCYEDGLQLRDYVSVHDVVRANLLVLKDPRADYEPFNVGGDRRVSVRDYALLVASSAGIEVEPRIPGIYRFGDTRHVISDVSKLGRLGWRPQVSLPEIVQEYRQWVRTQPGFKDYSDEAQQKMMQMGTLRACV